ncbi:orotate phosphoribosyltransferase [Desulfuromonas acetoxidans]|uniref:Orotate phosphoribosyltransferase n=1 Tax=Desulfuromonas acetoxidans (strain DSM 684 / 11070) TaxID=281689 RepID=Q1JZ43_DESA6|nr:orotate phosphoribosyltransferase [Desulfuromonas acetoxidans]EAT15451.1 orotate phosphoribosyltransferase [Desulfuromonas acetoxidans DSM 684]MBF0646733.1 orotate phosphoribosyltransferase [Desulfuromonas acetoxidans]NVD25895.1 orotate phosphoribosyltransferase [Desulfuromonas acetoxidans]NVE17829.1 orotate phosphoribosyltransferase [Desulfuromonas acetoxidans]
MTENERSELMEIIRELSYEQREVTLASGRKSNFYFDGKQTTLHPRGSVLVGKAFYKALENFDATVDGVGGLTMGADPIATAASLISSLEGTPIPAFIIRKEPKGHGTGQWLEGRKNVPPGSKVVIVEDVVTTGGSSMKAIERAQAEGLEVLGVVTLVDREEGGREFFEENKVPFFAIFTKSQVAG